MATESQRVHSDNASVESQIMARMRRAGRGSVWGAAQLLDIAQRNTLDQALTRLAKKHVIRRICHGLYLYPQTQPLIGEVPVTIGAITTALHASEPQPLVPSGAYACYLLGMMPEMPTHIVLLSQATTREIVLPHVHITVRPAAPRYLAGAGRLSAILIQAWRHVGAAHVDAAHITALKQRISHASRTTLHQDIRMAPAWMRPWMLQLMDAAPVE